MLGSFAFFLIVRVSENRWEAENFPFQVDILEYYENFKNPTNLNSFASARLKLSQFKRNRLFLDISFIFRICLIFIINDL